MVENSLLKPEEMAQVLEHLVGSYPKYFGSDEKTLSKVATAYYYFLKNYGRNDVWKVICNWIEENPTAPTIHDLIKRLDQKEKYRGMGITDD